MATKDDLRLLIKQERTLRVSLDNIKEFVQSIDGATDRRALDMRIARLDDIWQKYLDVRMRIELATEDIEYEVSEDELAETKEGAEAKLQQQTKLKMQRDRDNSKIIKDFENEVYNLK